MSAAAEARTRVLAFLDMWDDNEYSHRGNSIYGLASASVETELTSSDIRAALGDHP